ncbi:Flavin-binding monooxygenase-like family protein [Metarhizium album ARSEF 1941]|uniref:Flavin-binding monooxygenase-like family protein n=1 Tax=Metarhizium album (strain ARSEF 1941) TaxID=1081103 RepID=A0A0B2X1M7_METAS|nr:Flavin-binding monooxygenase-like family protein [Metarhizium album ARSEF 1941]KHN98995.1 Flavin-binding monooxygenase-like family protein [Metarhizium album ARSEF 1941]
MEATVDKFGLRHHMHFRVECVSASWNEDGFWDVRLRDLMTGTEYARTASILVSAVGGISRPRDVKFPGMDTFQGEMFHTARWNHKYDYRGKRMAVIGNGCSAAQVVPEVARQVAHVTQYARSPQWYHERPNRRFTCFERWCFRHVPLLGRILRLRLFLASDNMVTTYGPGETATRLRLRAEAHARDYIVSTAPQKYHHLLVPEFPLGMLRPFVRRDSSPSPPDRSAGCKRRIFDPGYLESLHLPNVELVPHGIEAIDQTGIVSTDGVKIEFDVIVLATGFDIQRFLAPMEVYGRGGRSLSQQWQESRGAQAYMGTYVNGFPNFAILFGPNTFPAHNSVLFASEVQVAFIAKTLLAPVLDRQLSTVEVKRTAEDQWVSRVHSRLRGGVFEAGCSNWYINSHGRNSASWPGYAADFWKESLKPQRGVFLKTRQSPWWMWYRAKRWMRTTSWTAYGILGLLMLWMMGGQRSGLGIQSSPRLGV